MAFQLLQSTDGDSLRLIDLCFGKGFTFNQSSLHVPFFAYLHASSVSIEDFVSMTIIKLCSNWCCKSLEFVLPHMCMVVNDHFVIS